MIQSPSPLRTWITFSLLPPPISTKGRSRAPTWMAGGGVLISISSVGGRSGEHSYARALRRPHVHRTERRAGAAAPRAARLLREAADARAARGVGPRARHRAGQQGAAPADGEGRLALLRLAEGVRRTGPQPGRPLHL